MALWVLMFYISTANSQLFRDEVCAHKGQPGVCKYIQDCPAAQADLKSGRYPTICSFEGFLPVVCCSQNTQTVSLRPNTTEIPGSKAAKMCEEYSKAVWRYERSPTLLLDAKPIKVNLCFQSSKPLIVGGEKAQAREFPHMALVGFGDKDDIKWWCGGSLISPGFVLTAAHCLWSRSIGGARWVRVGDLDIKVTTDKVEPQEVAVVERIAHPDYKPPSPYNDIGLLKLEKDLQLNEFVRPACLHTQFNTGAKDGIASGWGRIHWGSSEGSDFLMKVSLPIQPTEACSAAYKSFFTTTKLKDGIREDIMLCAGRMEGGKDTCKGDSGGPLQLLMSSPYCMYDIIGITSFGKSVCGAKDSPAVYTRVSYFVPWIEKIVWP